MAVSLSDPKVQKSLLIILLLGGMAYGYHGYVYGPKMEKIEKVSAELKKVETEVAYARTIVEASDTAFLRQQLERRTEDLELIKSLLPTQENLSELLERVTHVADRTGVKAALFEPATPIQHEMYQERPYKVTLRGGFHETAVFLSEVASLPRIIKPSGLSLVRKTRRETGEEEILTAEMTLTTYLLVQGLEQKQEKTTKPKR